MSDLLAAIGLVFVIEGALYALFPETMKQVVAQVLAMAETRLRQIGFACVLGGSGIVYLARMGG